MAYRFDQMDASSPTFHRSAPVLAVRDVLRSRNYYRDVLGFEEHGVWGEPPCFCILGRDTITVFLDQAPDAADIVNSHGWAAYFYVSGLDSIADDFRRRGAEIVRGPEDAVYGCREIDVRDPDGHLICFGQDLSPASNGPGL